MSTSRRERLLKKLQIGCGRARPVRAPRGTELHCKGWQQEAALRMLCNNLDPECGERPDELIVYGGTGRAARNWNCFDALVRSLLELENDETLLVQSGKPVGVLSTHRMGAARADRQLESGAPLGRLGSLQRVGEKRSYYVRSNDRRVLDLHRNARYPPGDL